MKKLILFELLSFFYYSANSQRIAESATFKFLNIATSSRHNYLGKAAIATFDENIDIGLANPALIQFNTKGKLMASSALYFTSVYGNVAYSHNNYKFDIPFIVGVNFISYGKQIRTDVDGNILGEFFPNELSIYLAASKTYKHYTFGLNTKLAYGNYYSAQIAGIAADFSMLYRDLDRDLYATILLKNIGYQFIGMSTINASMPFDIQLALSKRLKHLPFRFTIMAQDFHSWSETNTDTDYGIWPLNRYYSKNEMDIPTTILSHFVFGGEIYLGKVIKIGASYDVKKSIEGRFEQFRGLNGLALGCGVYTKKYDFGYSYSKITPISVSHQFTFSMNMNEILRR